MNFPDLQPLLVQRPPVPGVVGLLGDLQGRNDGNSGHLLLGAKSEEPGDGLQLFIEKIVIVKSLVTDGRSGPASRLQRLSRSKSGEVKNVSPDLSTNNGERRSVAEVLGHHLHLEAPDGELGGSS